MADNSLRIVVSGLIAQHPRLGGMSWHYLHYLLGLARLGHDVFYLEDSGQVPYDFSSGVSGVDAMLANCDANARHLDDVLSRFGLAGRWAYRCAPEARWHGMPDRERNQVLRSADLLLNVSGSLEQPSAYRDVPRLVYIDTDPVVTQIKYLSAPAEFAARVDAHDRHFSFGECLSALVPDTGHRWLPTRQPIYLSEWLPVADARPAYTTIMSWTSYPPLRFEGREYAQKDAEFQRFIELPSRVSSSALEIAMARTVHRKWQSRLENLPPRVRTLLAERSETSPQELLEATGWRVVDSNRRCGDIDTYRDYVRTSRGEWSVAKNAYVAGRSGWFSERSACYLAAGRPVIVQDTGFTAVLPAGEGLLAFETVDQAVEAIERVDAEYDRHCRAAKSLAEAYFDSDKVLTELLERALAISAS